MIDMIRSLISLIFAVSMMYMFLECRIKNKKNRYLLVLYVAILLICDGFVFLNFGHKNFMNLYPFLVQISEILAFVFVSKFNVIKVFFVHLTAIAITSSFSLVGLLFSYFFDSDRTVMYVVCFILYIPTWLFVYRYMRPSFLYMLNNTDKGWFGFCTIPLSYSALLYLVSKYNMNTVNIRTTFRNVMLIFILTIAAYVLILRLFRQTREQLTLQNEQNLLQMQVAAAQMHLEDLKGSQEKTIIYRHDMRHHLSLIDAYLTDNNQAAAQKYIKEVGETIENAVVEKYCSNYSVNLILYSYITKAKNEQIEVETQIDLPEETSVSDMDLCVIFANAIENAVNACKLIPSTNDRTLKILCKTKNHKLFIQITNSYEGTVMFVNDMPVSSEENHGLGTKSIAAVVQKYDGLYSFTAENGVFKTSIIL